MGFIYRSHAHVAMKMWPERKGFKSFAFASMLLFMVSIGFRFSYNRWWNEDVTIEVALAQMSTCDPEDAFRQRALLLTLQAWTSLARTFHLQYWIAYGTLVGYVQRRGLLPHDSDVDILIMARDTAQLVPIATALYHGNFTSVDSTLYALIVHPQWSIVGWENRSYYPSRGIHFVAPNARFIQRKLGLHVDIWPIYDAHSDRSMLFDYDVHYRWVSNPRSWTFPLRVCKFSGITVWCPAQPEQLIRATYGDSALHRSDKSCINGSWI